VCYSFDIAALDICYEIDIQSKVFSAFNHIVNSRLSVAHVDSVVLLYFICIVHLLANKLRHSIADK